jgi:F0F1-type ATP synthase membrane subunit b/b'
MSAKVKSARGVIFQMAQPAKEHNTPTQDDVQEAVGSIEQSHRDLRSEHSAYMRRCRVIRDAIGAAYENAKEHGIHKKELRALVKQREHERKAEEARANLEADEQNAFDMLKEKLGDLANTPLGKAALAQQGDVLDRLHA